MPDVPLPPLLRRWQQTWLYQAVLLPAFFAFGITVVAHGCLVNGVQNVTTVCLWGAVNAMLTGTLTAIFSGHSPGSASINTDGTPNKVVANVIAVQKAAEVAPNAATTMAATSVAQVAAQQASVVKEAVKP